MTFKFIGCICVYFEWLSSSGLTAQINRDILNVYLLLSTYEVFSSGCVLLKDQFIHSFLRKPTIVLVVIVLEDVNVQEMWLLGIKT